MNRSSAVLPGKIMEISAISNPRIKAIRALAIKKNREESATFLAEGMKLLVDALDKDWQLQTLVHSTAMRDHQSFQALAAKARVKGADIIEVPAKLISSITRKDNPQTVIGVVSQQWHAPPKCDATDPSSTWLALDRIRDPGNLGTIMRTADAAGVDGIILVGDTTDPYSFEAVRASMGSIFNMKLVKMEEARFVEWTTVWPGIKVGTHLEGSVDYRTVSYSDQPVLLLMGNEQQGLPENLATLCDHLVRIPMVGSADSLNLAIATGVMLFRMEKRLPEAST